MGLKISGLNELRERLERLRPEEVMARALAEQAQRMAARVREGLSETPGAAGHDEPWLQSGALRDSVGAQADGLQAVVGSSDPAAVPQELGTAHMPARPFLVPVAAGMGEEVARAVGAAMVAALRGESSGVSSTDASSSGGTNATAAQQRLAANQPTHKPIGGTGAGAAAKQPDATTSSAGSVTSDGADNTINGGFIREREGFTTDGIVPKENGKVLGQSGVTVGNGVDLGSKTVQQLKDLGVAQDIIDKLPPYLGKQGQAADDYLKDHPFSLTQKQAEDLSNIFLQKSANEVADRFNSDSKVGAFSDLPGNTKTMLVDIYHQYGNQLYGTNFWKQVTDGDWQGAYKNLMNFGDKYRTRRQLEAGLLNQDIQADSLPKPAEHH